MLYDAVYLAAHDELAQQIGRKAMILLTDGQDEGSQLRSRTRLRRPRNQTASSTCCSVRIVVFTVDSDGYSGEGEMKKLTQETGGRVIEVGNKYEKLKDAFDQIANELRSQYNIGYTPTNRRTGWNLPQDRNPRANNKLQDPIRGRILRGGPPREV